MINKIMNFIEQSNASVTDKQEILNYLKELEDDSLIYHALEMNGVDNWTWWDEAVEDYNKMKEEEE